MSFTIGAVLVGVLSAGALAQAPRPGVIFPDDLDQWHARIVVGRPGNFTFVQGPAKEGGVAGRRETGPGHIVFDREGNMYAACDTFIQVVGRDGIARALAGTPGIGGCTDGPAAEATFAGARDLAINNDGDIYVVDEINQVLRKLEKRSGGWHVMGTRPHGNAPVLPKRSKTGPAEKTPCARLSIN